MSMTQESLTKLLEDRGWEVHEQKTQFNNQFDHIDFDGDERLKKGMLKGISLYGISPNGYTLSLQAGAANYSTPREYTEDGYESLEFAIWKAVGEGRKDGPFIQHPELTGGDDVRGWADFDLVMLAIRTIESWDGDTHAKPIIKRDEHPWDVD